MPNSTAIVAAIGDGDHVHADFGSGLWEGGPIGIPITVVRGTQAKSRVQFEYASESDKGPYPIPANVAIEGGRAADGDRHALIVDRDRCKLYELFALYPTRRRLARRLRVRSSTCARTSSARPAGRPPTPPGCAILPGLARYEDVAKGRIDHALRFTVQRHTPLLRLAGASLRQRQAGPEPAADGDALPAEAELSRSAASRGRRESSSRR